MSVPPDPSVPAGPDAPAVRGVGHDLDPAALEVESAEAAQTATGATAVMVALPRAANLYFGLARPDDAIAVLDAVEDEARTQPALAAALALSRGTVLAFSGSVSRALEILAPITVDDPQLEVLRSWGWVTALVQSGRLDEARVALDAAELAHAEVEHAVGIPHISAHTISRAGLELGAGDLDEVERLAGVALDHATLDGATSQLPWAHWMRARAQLLRGRAQTSFEHARLAAAGARTSGSVLAQRVAAVGTAHALALVGRLSDAEELLEGLVDVPFHTGDFVRGRAWVRACGGDLAGARSLLRDAIDRAVAEGRLNSALDHAFDLVRLGESAAAPRVVELAAFVEGPFSAARATTATAVIAHDADALLDGASAFERLGMDLHAAECCVASATIARANGVDDEPARLRVAGLVSRIGEVRTPGLGRADGRSALTAREREIAVLSAAGRSGKEIADHLAISERTVENSLQNVYSKIGVTEGDDLRAALAAHARPDGDAG